MYKLGRRPRAHDSRIPKIEKLRVGETFPALPKSVDYGAGMPANLGVMLNDTLGDCTAAAVGHAQQVWTFVASKSMVTPPDSAIEALYELSGGYVPGDPSTDNGAVEQVVLTDWLKTPVAGNTLAGFVEIDVADLDEIKRSIWEAGVVYIGFNVPNYVMQSLTAPNSVWDIDPAADNTSAGGHAVVLCGYDPAGNMRLISWGNFYTMTPAFWNANVDEAYALADTDWITKTGQSPAGLTLPQLQSLMQELAMSSNPPTPAPTLIPVQVTVAKVTASLPVANAPQASTSVVVTDSSGVAQAPVILTGTETPPWSFQTSINPGAGSVVATDLDTNGKTIGTPLTAAFSVTAAAVYSQSSGITVTPVTSSVAAAAAHTKAARG
jgi:hypothetical protein